jgi:cyclophilin family peptidyl-prolyl cis-trans isomerase
VKRREIFENARKTGTLSSAPRKEQASSFVVSRRACMPFALLTATAAAVLAGCGKKKEQAKTGPAQYKVRFRTTKGDVIALIHRDWAPIGADHFYELVKMGYYNQNAFFRCVPNFIVQFGINGDPNVSKDWSQITIKDDPPKVPNKIGTLVFAQTSEPNSRTTQLFINLADNSGTLDPQGFTPFGEIVMGMENILHLNMEYGEEPKQEAITGTGNDYLEEHFPRLDYIKKTEVIT